MLRSGPVFAGQLSRRCSEVAPVAEMRPSWPTLGLIWGPGVQQLGPRVASSRQLWPASGQNPPISAELAPIWASLANADQNLDQTSQSWAKLNSASVDGIWVRFRDFAPASPTLAVVGQIRANIRPNLAEPRFPEQHSSNFGKHAQQRWGKFRAWGSGRSAGQFSGARGEQCFGNLEAPQLDLT